MKKYNSLPIIKLTFLLLVGIFYSCQNDTSTVGVPTITGFSPSSGGPVNTFVTINGTFFSSLSSNNVVKFNGVTATLIDVSATSITTLVPSGATTGNISITVGNSTVNSPSSFSVTSGQPAPIISKLSVSSGSSADGTSVTINGYNFSSTPSNNTVQFKGDNGATINAVVSSATSNALVINVPQGARSGKINLSVVGSSQTATSPSDFSVPGPTADSFTPNGSIVGSTIIITGTNFSKTSSNNIVNFNGVAALVKSVAIDDKNTANTLTVIVPVGATTGVINVTVDGQSASTKDKFTVN